MVWQPWLTVLFFAIGAALGTVSASFLLGHRRVKRITAPTQEYTIMARDEATGYVEVWTRYNEVASARNAITAFDELYEGRKVFWLNGEAEPGQEEKQTASFGLPTLPYLIARESGRSAPRVPVLSQQMGPYYEIVVKGLGPGPYGVTGRTGGVPWYVAERFYGSNARLNALDALVHRYPPGSSMR